MRFFQNLQSLPKFLKSNFKLKKIAKLKDLDSTPEIKQKVFYFVKNYTCYLANLSSYDFTIEGKEKLQGLKKTIIMSNHKTNFDPFFIQCNLPFIPGWFAKEELFKSKWFGHVGVVTRGYPINRGNPRQTSIQFLKAAKDFKNGRNLAMFPEGTRSKTDDMAPFKESIFSFASKLKADILPIKLSYRKKRKNSDGTKNNKCIIKILNVVKYEDYKDYETKKITQRIFKIIKDA